MHSTAEASENFLKVKIFVVIRVKGMKDLSCSSGLAACTSTNQLKITVLWHV
eukprot:SAG11_NODE_147_length_14771_cov_3.279648_11_plen_52_part_00